MDEYSLAEWLAPQTQQAIMVATALTVACQIENHLTDTNMLATILKRCADKLEQIASAAKGNSVLKTKSSLGMRVTPKLTHLVHLLQILECCLLISSIFELNSSTSIKN